MKPLFLIAVLLLGVSMLPSSAADRTMSRDSWRTAAQRDVLPFPRSERAQSVWASGACWSECGSYCAWGQTECLSRDAQGQCLKYTDKCDRYCQRECRTSGGPLLPIELPWD
ncbi:MAG: hypothetical protein ABI830_00770 [Pseudolabrys sp.]